MSTTSEHELPEEELELEQEQPAQDHVYAHKFWPKKPSARDREIQHRYRIECWTQEAIGKKYKMTQGRVSQIVTQVEQYDMVAISLQHHPPEERLRAKQILLNSLQYAQRRAIETFNAQAEPDTELAREETLDGAGEPKASTQKRGTRRGRPDARYLDLYIQLSERIAEVEEMVTAQRIEVHTHLSQMPDWKEDHDATFAVKITEELQRYNELCEELAIPSPRLPQESKREIEQWTRMERRENPHADVWECVHPRWAKVAKQVFMPHLDPDAPVPTNGNENFRPATVEGKAYPPDPNSPEALAAAEQKQAGSDYWQRWQKYISGQGSWDWVEAPPGGNGVTYEDGSWRTPDGRTGGGKGPGPSMAEVVQAEEERRERGG